MLVNGNKFLVLHSFAFIHFNNIIHFQLLMTYFVYKQNADK